MSSTAQGETAVKLCRLPPVFGYKTDVALDAVRTLSTANFANLTAKKDLFQIIFRQHIKLRDIKNKCTKKGNILKNCSNSCLSQKKERRRELHSEGYGQGQDDTNYILNISNNYLKSQIERSSQVRFSKPHNYLQCFPFSGTE